jgi:Na+-driven multidrug efflux pump
VSAGGRRSRDAILGGPIAPTLFALAWPMAISALINGWQVLISIFWIGRLVGTDGLSTIAIMDPVFQILALVTGAAHVGVQVLTAKATGQQEGSAIPVIVNGGYLAASFALLVTVVGIVALGPIAHALAGDVGVAHSLESYLLPWLLFFVAPTLNGVTMFAISATGWTRFGLIQTVLAIGLALALTPLFLGVFDLGVAGAAISDGTSDLLLLVLTCVGLYKFRDQLELGTWKREHWRVDLRLWKEIASVGFFYQAARAMDFVAQIVMVRIIMESGRAADVAAYGVVTLLIGNTTGALSCLGVAGSIMVGQNVGAKQPARARAILRTSVTWLAVISLGLVALASFPEPLIRVFTDDPEVVARAADTVAGLRWTMPAGLVSAALLRTYTAVSKNKLGSTVSVACAFIAIGVASLVPGEPLERVTLGLVVSQYLRLCILALFYRRSFSSIVG